MTESKSQLELHDGTHSRGDELLSIEVEIRHNHHWFLEASHKGEEP